MLAAKPSSAVKAKVPPPAPRVKLVAMPTKLVVVPSVAAMVPPFQANEPMLSVPTGAKLPASSCTALVPKAEAVVVCSVPLVIKVAPL